MRTGSTAHWARQVIALTILLFLMLWGCDAVRPPPTPPIIPDETQPATQVPAPILELTLELDGAVYKSGDSILAQVRLKNAGEMGVIVKNRFDLNYPWVDPGEIDVYFRILDPSGKGLVFGEYITMIIFVPTPNSTEFIMLGAGESLESRVYDLKYDYQLSGPGKYTIRAYYMNSSDPGDGRTAWKGEIPSNLVEFDVEP